jgi:hypothetical protein
MVRHPVRVCTAWQAMSTGERRCMNYETRIEERPGKRSGPIRLIRELR